MLATGGGLIVPNKQKPIMPWLALLLYRSKVWGELHSSRGSGPVGYSIDAASRLPPSLPTYLHIYLSTYPPVSAMPSMEVALMMRPRLCLRCGMKALNGQTLHDAPGRVVEKEEEGEGGMRSWETMVG